MAAGKRRILTREAGRRRSARRGRAAAEGRHQLPALAPDVDVVDARPALQRALLRLGDELVSLLRGREELDRAPGGDGDGRRASCRRTRTRSRRARRRARRGRSRGRSPCPRERSCAAAHSRAAPPRAPCPAPARPGRGRTSPRRRLRRLRQASPCVADARCARRARRAACGSPGRSTPPPGGRPGRAASPGSRSVRTMAGRSPSRSPRSSPTASASGMPLGQPPTPWSQAARSMFWAQRPASRDTGPLPLDRDRDHELRAADVPGREDEVGQRLARLGGLDDDEPPRLAVLAAPGEAAGVEDPALDVRRDRRRRVVAHLAAGREGEPRAPSRGSLVACDAHERPEHGAEERVHGGLVDEDAGVRQERRPGAAPPVRDGGGRSPPSRARARGSRAFAATTPCFQPRPPAASKSAPKTAPLARCAARPASRQRGPSRVRSAPSRRTSE